MHKPVGLSTSKAYRSLRFQSQTHREPRARWVCGRDLDVDEIMSQSGEGTPVRVLAGPGESDDRQSPHGLSLPHGDEAGSDIAPQAARSDRSDVHDLREVPFHEPNVAIDDPFAEFEEDPFDDEATQINDESLLAEESTTILRDEPKPAELVVEVGKDRGKRFVLGVGETSIGRSIDNDVILTDISVSRKHLRVELDGERLTLFDLLSGNGSLVNGERVRESPVFHADRIEIGESVLCIDAPRFARAVLPGTPAAPVPAPPGSTAPAIVQPPGSHPAPMGGITPGPVPPGALPGHFVRPGPASGVEVSDPDFPRTLELRHGEGMVVGGVAASGAALSTLPPPQPASGLPRSWVFGFMVLGCVIFALLGATITAVMIRRGADSPVASFDAETAFEEGTRAMAEARYADAREHFDRITKLRPEQAAAHEALADAQEALHHQRFVEEAEEAARDENWPVAIQRADRVPDGSRLQEEAREVARNAQARWVAELDLEAREALDEGDLEEARLRLQEARQAAPQDPRVTRLEDALRESEGHASRETRPRRGAAPSPSADSRSDPRAAGSRPAVPPTTRTAAAQRTAPSSMRRRAAQNPRRGAGPRLPTSPGVSSRRPTASAPRNTAVRSADVGELIAQARRQGTNTSMGCQTVRRALQAAPDDSQARALMGQCTQNAQQLLGRAGATRSSHIYLQVMQMVGPSHPLFAQARERYAELRRDEDE